MTAFKTLYQKPTVDIKDTTSVNNSLWRWEEGIWSVKVKGSHLYGYLQYMFGLRKMSNLLQVGQVIRTTLVLVLVTLLWTFLLYFPNPVQTAAWTPMCQWLSIHPLCKCLIKTNCSEKWTLEPVHCFWKAFSALWMSLQSNQPQTVGTINN